MGMPTLTYHTVIILFVLLNGPINTIAISLLPTLIRSSNKVTNFDIWLWGCLSGRIINRKSPCWTRRVVELVCSLSMSAGNLSGCWTLWEGAWRMIRCWSAPHLVFRRMLAMMFPCTMCPLSPSWMGWPGARVMGNSMSYTLHVDASANGIKHSSYPTDTNRAVFVNLLGLW